MIIVSVLYPGGASAKFDQTYYLQKHIPLVKSRWEGKGLQEVRVLRGAGAAGGGPAPFPVIALLTFGSHQDFQRCAEANGPEIFADIPNFTNVQPVVQVNDVIG